MLIIVIALSTAAALTLAASITYTMYHFACCIAVMSRCKQTALQSSSIPLASHAELVQKLAEVLTGAVIIAAVEGAPSKQLLATALQAIAALAVTDLGTTEDGQGKPLKHIINLHIHTYFHNIQRDI
jgi:hypothetical protein